MKLNQEIAYLTTRLVRTIESEKRIEEDLSRVMESANCSTYKLGLGFERVDMKVRRVTKSSLCLAPPTRMRKKPSRPKTPSTLTTQNPRRHRYSSDGFYPRSESRRLDGPRFFPSWIPFFSFE